MDCTEALDLLYLSFEGQITPSQQVALNAHRRTCFACSTKLAKAEKFQQLLKRVPQVTVPRGLEARIIAHVSAHAGVIAARKPRAWTLPTLSLPRFELPKLQLSFGGVLAMGGVLAAAFAIFIVANGIINSLPFGSSAVTALVQGQLQAAGPNAQGVISGQQPITAGETITNASAKPAVIAFSPNLALRIAPSTQVEFGGVRLDRATNQVNIGTLRLTRGTVQIRENLHHDATPVHIATNLATFVPTGTVFTVAQEQKLTYLAVSKGMVAVYGPHKFFKVGPGKSLRILANGGVLWDKVPTKN